jgi:hypothetical protein
MRIELKRKPVGKVFGMESVDGKNPEIAFSGFSEDAELAELVASEVINGNDEVLRRLLVSAVNDELFALAINPFAKLRPATLNDEKWKTVETVAKSMVKNMGLPVDKAVKLALSAVE